MFEAFQSVPYFSVLLGVALIGLSSVLLFAFIGRISGIYGMAFSLMATICDKNIWRIVFLMGLVSGSLLYHYLTGAAYPPAPDTSLPLLIVAVLLFGYGTSMVNGCTRCHGLYGLDRLSLRSLYATLTFMGSAIATLYIAKYLLGATT